MPTDPLAIASTAAYALMTLAVVLTIFVPFFPGALAVLVAVLGYRGAEFAVLHAPPTGARIGLVVGLLTICLVGAFSSQLAERLGFRFTYASPQLVWGGFLAMILVAVVGGPLWLQIIGLFLGGIVACVGVEKRPFGEAVARGPMAIYSLLGPRGFQLLMIVLAGNFVLAYGL